MKRESFAPLASPDYLSGCTGIGPEACLMKLYRLLGIACIFISLVFSSCGNDPQRPGTGVISVSVINIGTEDPVEGVEIVVNPVKVAGQTDADGLAVFTIAPGDYFIDAHVCCVGPGFIEYHEPVTVVAGKTEEVTLTACLDCE
jgi:hypothetical protein